MPQLSVIVPVYKVEPFVAKCIESILSQTFGDLELILVDDGSPDESGRVCDTYASKDSRVNVIHQANHGVSHARNTGIANAGGRYIAFVDADDWIESDMYEKLFSELHSNPDLDIVACNRFLDEDTVHNYHPRTEFRSKDSILADLFSKPSLMMGSCCNKIIRAEAVKRHRFNEKIKVWEDLIFLSEVYLNECTSAVYIPDYLYHYRTNENSVTNSRPYYAKKFYKEFIFKPLKNYSDKTAAISLDYFLDSSLQLLRTYKKTGARENRKEILDVKKTILYWVIYGISRGLLDRHRFNRYLAEGVLK